MSYPGAQDRAAIEARFRRLENQVRRLLAQGSAAGIPAFLTKVQSTVIGDLEAHKAAPDPHRQYTTDDEAAAIAAEAVAGHVAEGDPHEQYTTDAEVLLLIEENAAGFDDSDIDGGVASSHYLGLHVDGGATYNEALTEGVIDGGGA